MASVSLLQAVRSRTHLMAMGALMCTMALWSTAFPGIRMVLERVDPLSMTIARMACATATLLVVGVGMGIRLPKRRDLFPIAMAGVLGFSVYHLSLNFGMTQTPAGVSSFLIATGPVWTSVLAARYLKERLTQRRVMGLVLSMGGIGVMALGRGGGGAVSIGAMWIVVAAWSAAGSVVIQKRLLERYSALELTVYMVVAGLLPYLALLPWSMPGIRQISAQDWGLLLYLGVGPVGLGFLCYSVALRHLPASRVAQMILIVPPLSATWAWLLLGEELSQSLYVGGALVLAGVCLGATMPRGQRVPPSPCYPVQGVLES